MRRVRTASGPAQTSGERAALVTGACKLTRLTPTPANPALRANAPISIFAFQDPERNVVVRDGSIARAVGQRAGRCGCGSVSRSITVMAPATSPAPSRENDTAARL